ncbi:hypothetical protein KPB2_5565 [Klebsiella pneumoniae Kb677]|nr:hypothetical protein KPB2_5565 [Klebsiella pneumoniae Kb677]
MSHSKKAEGRSLLAERLLRLVRPPEKRGKKGQTVASREAEKSTTAHESTAATGGAGRGPKVRGPRTRPTGVFSPTSPIASRISQAQVTESKIRGQGTHHR